MYSPLVSSGSRNGSIIVAVGGVGGSSRLSVMLL